MVETTPVPEGKVFPGQGHVLAVAYWGPGRSPVVYNPEEHGLPTELYEAWIEHDDDFVDAVLAWMNDGIQKNLVTVWDTPWVVRWAKEAFKGKYGTRYQWAECVIGDAVYEAQSSEIEYDIDLVGMIDWDEVARVVEDNDEILFVFEDSRDRYSTVYAFAGADAEKPEDYRKEWETEIREAEEAAARPGKWMVKRTDATEGTPVFREPEEGNLGAMMIAILSIVSQHNLGINFDPITALAGREPVEVSVLVNGVIYELAWHQE